MEYIILFGHLSSFDYNAGAADAASDVLVALA
jgi:hypothetical protein